jgi:CBS domain-containing protein
MKTERVRDWMTPNPICATPKTTLPETHQLMKEHNIRRLPIVEGGKLVGIVTLGDVRGARPSEATSLSIFEINYLLSRLTLDHIMSRNPITVTPETTIGEAARLMLHHKVAGLPVVEGGRVAGILTESDIFRMVVRTWEKENPQAAEYA